MAVEQSIIGQDGLERPYHKIPTFSIFLNSDGTCQMQIVTQNWKDKNSRINNAQALTLQHSVIGLPAGIMAVAYEMLKKYFPEYDAGADAVTDDWKESMPSSKITAVTQTMDGKLLDKKEV